MAILAVLRTAARDVFRRLMDGVDPNLVDKAEAALAARPGVTAVRSVRMRWIGHRLHADAELDIDPGISLDEAHRIAHDAEHELIHELPKLDSAMIHAYPSHSSGGPSLQEHCASEDENSCGGECRACGGGCGVAVSGGDDEPANQSAGRIRDV